MEEEEEPKEDKKEEKKSSETRVPLQDRHKKCLDCGKAISSQIHDKCRACNTKEPTENTPNEN